MIRTRPMLILAFAIYALFSSGGCNFEPAPKAYALVTLKHDETRIQMVAIMEIPGEGECETAFQEFMNGFSGEEGSEGWRQTEKSCQQVLEPLYQNVMSRGTFHATYLAFSPRNDWEYEATAFRPRKPRRSAMRSRKTWERAWTSKRSASREQSVSQEAGRCERRNG